MNIKTKAATSSLR